MTTKEERLKEIDDLFDDFSKVAVGKTANAVISASAVVISMGLWRFDPLQRAKMLAHIDELIIEHLKVMDAKHGKPEGSTK